MTTMHHMHLGGCLAGSRCELYAIGDSVSAQKDLRVRLHQTNSPQQERMHWPQQYVDMQQQKQSMQKLQHPSMLEEYMDQRTSSPFGGKQALFSIPSTGECCSYDDEQCNATLDSSYVHYGQDDGLFNHISLETWTEKSCWDDLIVQVDASSDDAHDSPLGSDFTSAESEDTAECSGNNVYCTTKWGWCEDDEMQAPRFACKRARNT